MNTAESGLALRDLLAVRLAPLTPGQAALFRAVDWPMVLATPDGEEPPDFERFADSLTAPQLDELSKAYGDLTRSLFVRGTA